MPSFGDRIIAYLTGHLPDFVRKPEKMGRSTFRTTLLLIGLAAPLLLIVNACPQEMAIAKSPIKNSQGINYVPANPAAYLPGATIQGWADNFQDDSIRQHSFQLWAAITARTGQIYSVTDSAGITTSADLAVFDTWFDEFEMFDSPPTSCAPPGNCKQARHYHRARQTVGSGGSGGAEVISFNKYSLEFKNYVEQYHYNQKDVLIALNNKFIQDNTPLEKRITENSPAFRSTYVVPPDG